MQMFSSREHEPTAPGSLLPRGISIKGSVKFRKLLIDGDMEGTINSTGTLTIEERAQIRGEISRRVQDIEEAGKLDRQYEVFENYYTEEYARLLRSEDRR